MNHVRYRIVVAGELGPRFAGAFEGMTVERGERCTVISGTVRDDAHLHGLLERVASLGLRLVSVTDEGSAEG